MANRSGAVSQAAIGYQGDVATSGANFSTEVVATDRLLFTSGNPKTNRDAIKEDALIGEIGRGTPSQGLETSEDSINAYVPYTHKGGAGNLISSDMLIAAIMGGATWDAVNSTWQMTFSNLSLPAITVGYFFGTVTAGQLRMALGFMPTSMELSCELTTGDAAKLTVSIDGIAYGTTSSSSTNTKSAIDGIDHLGHSNILAHQMVWYLSDDLSDALATADKVIVKKFALKVDRALESEAYGTPDATHVDAKKILPPIVDDRRDVTLTLEIPRYEDETYRNFEVNADMLQGKVLFTDGTNQFNIFFPNIYVDDTDVPLDGAGAFKQTLSCLLSKRDATQLADGIMTFSDGTTDIDDEFGIEIKNDRTTSDSPLG